VVTPEQGNFYGKITQELLTKMDGADVNIWWQTQTEELLGFSPSQLLFQFDDYDAVQAAADAA
jgi:hypothetical protein